MKKPSVLFICVHNAARSQMAEEFLRMHGGDRFTADSAGFEPGTLLPLVVEAMREKGVDISAKKPKSVFDLYKSGALYDYVVTVCNETEHACPVFPGVTKREHWPFPNPSEIQHGPGTDEEKLARIRPIRDEIEARIKAWLATQP
jgi:arsenate reductase (thioredoxin)